MAEWKKQLHARLWANISKLNISDDRKQELLESELASAVSATESGKAFGAADIAEKAGEKSGNE